MFIDTVELRRRYLQRLAGVQENKVYIGPQTFSLFINNSCNLSCQYCFSHHAPGHPARFEKTSFFPWEKFLGIVRDCVDLKVDEIHISGAGEPTIHPLFCKMMRHLEQQPVYIKLLTNGTFPLDHCKDVIRGDSVVINFSAVDRQQYHDLQGKDLFDRVVANIERLVSLRDTGKPGFRIEIVYVVNAGNVDQKQKMRDLASRLGVHVVSFQKMSVNAYNQGIALPEGPGEREGKRISPICLKGWFYAGADPVTATICCRTFQMSLDDLDKASFKQFWFSPRMMKMRLLGKHGRIQEISKACQTCPFYDEDT